MVKNLLLSIFLCFITGILWPVCDKFDYVVYHSNVSFLSQNTYLMADGCFLFCPLLSTIMFL